MHVNECLILRTLLAPEGGVGGEFGVFVLRLLDANTGACAVRQAAMIFTRLFRFVLSLQCGWKGGGGGPPNSGRGGGVVLQREIGVRLSCE